MQDMNKVHALLDSPFKFHHFSSQGKGKVDPVLKLSITP
jgi:hypothetical protein